MEELRNLFEAHSPIRDFRYSRVGEDGSTMHIRVNGQPFQDEKGDFQGYRGTVVDETAWIEEIKSRETDLIQAKDDAEEANRAKSDFLASMSHELRSPLNAVIGFAEVIKDQILGPGASVKYADYAKDIYQSGRHLLGLINDILDLSKIEAGKMTLEDQDLDMGELLGAALHTQGEGLRAKGLTAKTELAPDLPLLRANQKLVHQMLANLLSNSVSFTSGGGTIRVSANLAPDGGITLSVEDDGVCIAPEDMPMVMAPFGQAKNVYKRDFQGTGLGIPIVLSLIELHGGSLALESQPGAGTKATLAFPPERSILINQLARNG